MIRARIQFPDGSSIEIGKTISDDEFAALAKAIQKGKTKTPVDFEIINRRGRVVRRGIGRVISRVTDEKTIVKILVIQEKD